MIWLFYDSRIKICRKHINHFFVKILYFLNLFLNRFQIDWRVFPNILVDPNFAFGVVGNEDHFEGGLKEAKLIEKPLKTNERLFDNIE